MNYKKFTNAKHLQPEKTYLQTKLTAVMPKLMEKVIQSSDGKFVFTHETFPDLLVEEITITSLEEQLERAVRRHFRGQSNKHIDYLFTLLLA